MILFMGYSVVVAALLGMAAARVESAQRGRAWATRWTWLASLGTSLGVGAWALFRPAPSTVAAALISSAYSGASLMRNLAAASAKSSARSRSPASSRLKPRTERNMP